MTPPQTVLSGRYELGEPIGRGGMATVLTGRDLRLGRTVAIKLLRSDLIEDPQFAARFRREALAIAALNHRAIVSVYDSGEQDINGTVVPYIVMEYVQGKTLRDVIATGNRVLPERGLEIAAEILDALEASHRAGIVHRDIKPGNVMLTPDGAVKVMDFGIARAVGTATMTATDVVIGTANYLSPEQARGESVDFRSDIYSTGCVLYELLTGRPPFTGDSPVAVIYQHVSEEPPPPGVRPDIDTVVLDALAKNPRDRYQSAAEMRADLLRVLDGAAPIGPTRPDTGALPVPPGGVPRDPYNDTVEGGGYEEDPAERRRQKIAFAGAAAALLALVATAAFIVPGLLGGPSDSPGTAPAESTSPSEPDPIGSPTDSDDERTARTGEDDDDSEESPSQSPTNTPSQSPTSPPSRSPSPEPSDPESPSPEPSEPESPSKKPSTRPPSPGGSQSPDPGD